MKFLLLENKEEKGKACPQIQECSSQTRNRPFAFPALFFEILK